MRHCTWFGTCLLSCTKSFSIPSTAVATLSNTCRVVADQGAKAGSKHLWLSDVCLGQQLTLPPTSEDLAVNIYLLMHPT
jgi:hypothetical protein